MTELKSVLEALLFAAPAPRSAEDLKTLLTRAADQCEEPAVRALKKTRVAEITAALEALQAELEAAGRSFRLACVAGTWQFVARPDFAPWLRALAGERARPARLSQPALETLTIIAYRQPITRAEIEQIRGVSVDGVLQTLLERGLIEVVGRADVVGRPQMYGTTRAFLEYFGLARLEDLPGGDELRRIPVERPPALLTVEPGLATVPPEQLNLQAPPAPAPGVAPVPSLPEAPAPDTPAGAPVPPPRPDSESDA